MASVSAGRLFHRYDIQMGREMITEFTEQESLFINYAKALGILCVVTGHYGWNPLPIFNPYIYHMPLFFIIGGIIAKPIRNGTIWTLKIFKKYILYMVIWYFSIATITYILNRFLNTSIESKYLANDITTIVTYPITHNMHNNKLFLTSWFIVSYLISTSIFNFIITIINILKYKNIHNIKNILLATGLII